MRRAAAAGLLAASVALAQPSLAPLDGAGASPAPPWREERRELRTDVQRAFGDELAELPRITAVLIGADADNSGGHGLGFVAGLALR